MAYQPLSSLQYLSNVQANAKPLPTNPAVPGMLQSLAPKPKVTVTPTATNVGGVSYANNGKTDSATPTPIGVKAKSATDTLKGDTNTLASKNIKTQDSGNTGGKTTDGGTESTNGYNANNNFNTNTGNAPAGTPVASATTQSSTGYDPNDVGLYGKLVTDLANRSTQSGKDYQDAQAEAKRVSDEQTALAQDYAHKTNNIAGTAGFLTQQTGLQGQLNNQYNTVQNALASQYSGATNRLGAANTQQGLLQSALSTAAGAAAPNGNIINVNPITGLPTAGGSLGQLANTAGQVQGIQSGAAAAAAAGGQTEAQNKIALGTAATGANAHSIGDFTNQINTTQKSVSTLRNLASQIVPNMGTTGFNPTSSPIGNETFAQYFTEKNPAAKAGLVAGLGELKNQISNVIASATGLTPSGVTAVADTYDLTTLNPQQLNDFLQYVDQYAQSNMKAAQDSITTISSGGVPKANPGILPAPTPNSTGQALVTTGARLGEGFIKDVISQVGNAASGATAGAAAGAAKSLLI